jgi:type I restriction enzyme M protein
VLFFEKGAPTESIWYYQLNLERNLGKTNPLNEEDLAEFVELQKTKADSENSWLIKINGIDKNSIDLSVKNPNQNVEVIYREPKEIIIEIKKLDDDTQRILSSIEGIL